MSRFIVDELMVPIEAPPEIAALLLQAAQDGLIENTKDAESVWTELVSIASMHCKCNFEKLGIKHG